jgi:acyl-coenzyme A synthetase/AMP-(fatty) acid ligase
VSDVHDVRSGRVTAISLPTGEWFVVIEPASRSQLTERERQRLVHEVNRAAVVACSIRPDRVLLLPPGQLPMTSSGKAQRSEVARRFLNGSLL